jgi:DNA-binding IclR family transcriptional regulator
LASRTEIEGIDVTTPLAVNGLGPLDASEEDNDRQFVTALARGLELLRCFGPREKYLDVTELARRTGVPKPTVSRLAGTLCKLGYLNFSKSYAKYSLGAGVLSFGYSMLSNVDIRHIAKPLMQELAEHSQASVSIGVRDRFSMVYVESVRSSAPIALQRGIGARLDLAATAIGRALIAGLPELEREAVLEQIQKRNVENWPAIKSRLEIAFRDYAERGFCLSIGEWEREIVAVGVPLLNSNGSVTAFNCGGPAYALTRDRLEHDVGPKLVSLVKQVGNMMGRH